MNANSFCFAVAAAVAMVCPGRPALTADFNIKDYGAKEGDVECQTAAIQKAIDAAAMAGGGRVVVPEGTFMSGTIELKSHVELHLMPNAILLGSPRCEDYPEAPAASLKHVVSDMLPRYRNACFIRADEAEDIAITGRGIIDGNGTRFVRLKKGAENYTWGWAYERIPGLMTPPRVVFFAGCKKVRLLDHCMRNQPSGWSYWISDCDDVVCKNLKIKADVRYPNNDGLHINSSRDVMIEGCDIECGDDSIVVRACNSALKKKENPPCERVTVNNCRLKSYSSAIRLGWIHDGVIRDCKFTNLKIADSSTGIGIVLPMRYGDIRNGRMSDEGREATLIEKILFENVTMDKVYSHPLKVQLHWSDEVKCSGIRDFTFRNVTATALEHFYISGRGCVSNFTFENCRFTRLAECDMPITSNEHGAAAWGRFRGGGIDGCKNFKYVNTVFDGAPGGDYPIAAVPYKDVKVTGGFWLPRMETNRLVTLNTDFEKCGEYRIPNFERAAKGEIGTFQGTPFDDSDVFKVVEGASYILGTIEDEELDAFTDDLIAKFAGAQEPDGYLYTARTLCATNFNNWLTRQVMPHGRWNAVNQSHELYNAGHLYEAAVAHYLATGKTNLFAVAVKNADMVCRTFGPEPSQVHDAPGHEEIELALMKLYRVTRNRRYFDTARYFLERRGRFGNGRAKKIGDGECANRQDHQPVTEQREAVGHAVRAAYLYCAMADMCAYMNDPQYREAVDAIWKDITDWKLYLTGGIGASPKGEAFGGAYELPNETAYNETCAAIGNALFNERMFRLTGQSNYMDLVELIIYNGFLSGVSLSGDEFFYPNPLACKKGYRRSKWFGRSCCPVNVVRFIPQIPSFAFSTRGDELYWNLYLEAEATLKLKSGAVKLSEKTAYPWEGTAKLTVEPEKDGQTFTLRVRIPKWLSDRPVPGELYHYSDWKHTPWKIRVNGEEYKCSAPWGYAEIKRAWKKGDVVEADFPIATRRVQAHDKVVADRDLAAVMRGPVVFCAEGADNHDAHMTGSKKDEPGAAIPLKSAFTVGSVDICGNRFPKLTADNGLKLIPYFAWAHRGENEMCVWFNMWIKENTK